MERWQQTKELFDAVVELSRVERAAMLAQRCADADVRTEVERLLNLHAAVGSFFDGPAVPQQAVKPGQVLADRFNIIRLAGRGGMDEFYEAHDTRLDRCVALSFLPDEQSTRGWPSLVRWELAKVWLLRELDKREMR
jgi:hypothetical protein